MAGDGEMKGEDEYTRGGLKRWQEEKEGGRSGCSLNNYARRL